MKISLVIMAAGIGSRFGGLKQIEPVGKHNEIIADYSIFDAKAAGFSKVIFVIKKEIEQVFREQVYNRISKVIDSECVFQEITDLPKGFSLPEGRVKPWGTAQAVLACKNVVKEPFAVINADDFYGASAYKELYDYLCANPDGEQYNYCMAGYSLKNTVTENGFVSRGVCKTSDGGYLEDIEEIVHIEKMKDGIKYTEDGKNYKDLPEDTIVSMNAWGFTPSIFGEIENRFSNFLSANANSENVKKVEFYLPSVVKELIEEKKARVKVLPAKDMWYGFTYKEDKETVKAAIQNLTDSGKYPASGLWSKK